MVQTETALSPAQTRLLTVTESVAILRDSFKFSGSREFGQKRLLKAIHMLFPDARFNLDYEGRSTLVGSVADMHTAMVNAGIHGNSSRYYASDPGKTPEDTARKFMFAMDSAFSGKPADRETLLPLVILDLLQSDAKYLVGNIIDFGKGQLQLLPAEGRPVDPRRADIWRSAFAENVVMGDRTGNPFFDEVFKEARKVLTASWGIKHPLQLRLAAQIIDTYNSKPHHTRKATLPSELETLLSGQSRVLSTPELFEVTRPVPEK